MTEINETDRVKRKTRSVDVNGLETRYTYAEGGRVETVTHPDRSTRIVTRYLDGRLKSITGTGVIPEYYSYGVHADGTTWTRSTPPVPTATLPPDQLRHRRTVARGAAAPACDGSTLTTHYRYDTYGRLAQSRPGQADTLYQYDALGQLSRSGLDVDGNGRLDSASPIASPTARSAIK